MAAQRYISTSFWDDAWIQSLEPFEKFIYMYLLTNTLTNIAGVYEITYRRISFDTGYPIDMVCEAIKHFERDKKAYFFNEEWIVLPNWPKHQRPTKRNTIKKGIDEVLKSLPDEVWSFINTVEYRYEFLGDIDRKIYPIDTPSIPHAYEASYIDIDLDIDIDIDKEKEEKKNPPPFEEIISYFNSVVGRNLNHTSEGHRKPIRARWNEGYTLDDFKRVIDVKAKEWMGTRMESNLKPSTLFALKHFDNYLNQPMPMTNQERNLAILQSYVEKMDCELPGGEDDENRSDRSDGIPF